MSVRGDFDGAARGAASCTSLSWRVHHELPHRTRLRLVGKGGGRVAAAAVERAAEAVAGVRHARFCSETGSLLVAHDGADSTRRELRRALELVRLDDAAANASVRDGRADAPRETHEAIKAAVLSLVGAALPPGPRAAFKLVQGLSALRALRPRAQ